MIILSGCESENGINNADIDLKLEIIGKWKDNNGYTITYEPQGKFIDTLYHYFENDTVIIIRNGKYNISNSVLYYTEFIVDTVISSGSTIGVGMYEASYEIAIHNLILKRKALSILNNIGLNKNVLWDKWQTEKYYAQFEINNREATYHGKQIIQYEFKQDTNRCIETKTFQNAVNDSIDEYTYLYDYTYAEPYLDLSYYRNILVKFFDNKMYWYYDRNMNDLFKKK